MDRISNQVFSNFFFLNPVFFLEIARIRSHLAKCVLPQQIFDVSENVVAKVNFALQKFHAGLIDADELFHVINAAEHELKTSVKQTKLHDVCKILEIEIVPYVGLINRITCSETIDVQFFVCKDYELKTLKSTERKILKGRISLEKGRKKLIRAEGKILGYPKCCIDEYARSKGGFPAESKLILEMIESNAFLKLLEHLERSEVIPFYSLFTSNFYPCSLECRRAAKIGEKLDNWLYQGNKIFSDAFRVRTMMNALYNLCTAYSAHIAGSESFFGNRLREFFSKLDSSHVELITSITPHMRRLTEFTNVFISRIYASLQESSRNA